MERLMFQHPFLMLAVTFAVMSAIITRLLTSKGFFEGHEFRGIQGLIFLIMLYLIVVMELIMLVAPMSNSWMPEQLWSLAALSVSAFCLRSVNRMVKRRANEQAYTS